jgi:hypothetical protein
MSVKKPKKFFANMPERGSYQIPKHLPNPNLNYKTCLQILSEAKARQLWLKMI